MCLISMSSSSSDVGGGRHHHRTARIGPCVVASPVPTRNPEQHLGFISRVARWNSSAALVYRRKNAVDMIATELALCSGGGRMLVVDPPPEGIGRRGGELYVQGRMENIEIGDIC